ncbi:MAG TPA: hypothetical protein VN281_15825 [Verrucomicrobiae bacterium]|nr:hypothetical protein [Verrucomicrobiae bacterium]
MKIILFLALVFILAAALAIKCLPQWLGISLILLFGIPLVWIVWKIRKFFKKVKAKLGDILPQEKLCSLQPNEPFKGKGFAFTLPVACDVSQTAVKDFEALILKPKMEIGGAPKESMITASTFSVEEMRAKINQQLERIFSNIQELRSEDFAPIEIGGRHGQRRAFSASKDSKNLQGEAVYLGDESYAIAWVAMSTPETFDGLTAKYRELAQLIERTPTAELAEEARSSAGAA